MATVSRREELRARLEELRGLGNVYAASGEPPPPELSAEYQQLVEALAREEEE